MDLRPSGLTTECTHDPRDGAGFAKYYIRFTQLALKVTAYAWGCMRAVHIRVIDSDSRNCPLAPESILGTHVCAHIRVSWNVLVATPHIIGMFLTCQRTQSRVLNS